MARIVDPRLAINVNRQAQTATCVVTCRVTFNETEVEDMAQSTRWRLECALWDQDEGLDADDLIYQYSSRSFPDSTPTLSETVRFEEVIALSKLNEDWFGAEKIYGRLKLVFVRPPTVVAKTNVIEREFGN